MNSRWYIYLAVGCILGLAAYTLTPHIEKTVSDLHMERGDIVTITAACSPKGDLEVPHIFACLREAAKELLTNYSAKEIMETLESSAAITAKYGNCHTIGHAVGLETYDKFQDLDTAIAQCNNSCAFACIHGVIAESIAQEYGDIEAGESMAHASGEEIETIGDKYCTKGVFCHAIGHLLFIAYNDFDKALSGCRRISDSIKYHFSTCQGGVFMQAAGGLRGSLSFEGIVSPSPVIPRNDYLYPCGTLKEQYLHQCFLYLNGYEEILFPKNHIRDTATRVSILKERCESAGFTAIGRSACFEGIGINTFGDRALAVDKSAAPTFCDQFSTEADRKSCVMGRLYWISGFVSYPQAVDYCASISANMSEFCWNVLFQFIDKEYGIGTDGPIVCAKVVEKNKCERERRRYETIKNTLPDYRFGLYGKMSSTGGL